MSLASAANRYLAAAAAMCLLSSCGSDGASDEPAAVIQVQPAPTSPPTPTPTPTPTPAPTVSPSIAMIAGAAPGEALTGVLPCGQGTLTRDSDRHVTDVALTGAQIGNAFNLSYRATDNYALDVNGFGGGIFTPADKRTWSGGPYDQFLNPVQGEFFVFRTGPFGSATFSALGADTSLDSFCFFAVGLPIDSLPVQATDYVGRVDGLARIGTRIVRLFSTNVAIQLAPNAASAVVEFGLLARDEPFGDFMRLAGVDIGTVKAAVTLDANGYVRRAPLSGAGFSGELAGQLVGEAKDNVSGRGGAGMVLEFTLTNAQGDIAFGVIAADANLI